MRTSECLMKVLHPVFQLHLAIQMHLSLSTLRPSIHLAECPQDATQAYATRVHANVISNVK